MKRLLFLFTVLALLLTACEGPQGPPGFDGLDGLDGEIIASSAFEIEIDFNAANNFEYVEAYGFNVLPSDVTLDLQLLGPRSFDRGHPEPAAHLPSASTVAAPCAERF